MHRAPSFRPPTRRISLAALFLAYPLVATAVAQSLPGWGPYTFEMTPSDAITQTKRVLLPGKDGPDLLDSTRIDGQLYTVGLYFRGASNPRLWKIQLHAEIAKKMDQGECHRIFDRIAGDLKKRYGEMEGNTAKTPLIGRVAAFKKKFSDESMLTISEVSSDRCDINVIYEAPPLKPLEGLGF